MQRVEPANIAIATCEALVVKVMKVWLFIEVGDPRQAVAGVVGLRAKAGADDPHVYKANVRAEDEEAGGKGDQVGDEEFDGVCVEGGEGEWGGELVMALVDALVQAAFVEGPVGVEEEDLVYEEMCDEHLRALGKGW